MRSVPLHSEELPPIVLFVDSNGTALASYSAEFERAGLWVATFTNPMEAIEVVRELRPDLVVTTTSDDAEFDLVTALKSDAATNGVPVILLAERVDEEVVGVPVADIRLQKPVAAGRLLDCSQELIARSHEARKRNEPTREPPQHLVLKAGEVVNRRQTRRGCPTCGKPLEWIEHGRLNGVEYDYYRWCATGCGLYCYETRADTWIKLV